jgi:hypothetical protein
MSAKKMSPARLLAELFLLPISFQLAILVRRDFNIGQAVRLETENSLPFYLLFLSLWLLFTFAIRPYFSTRANEFQLIPAGTAILASVAFLLSNNFIDVAPRSLFILFFLISSVLLIAVHLLSSTMSPARQSRLQNLSLAVVTRFPNLDNFLYRIQADLLVAILAGLSLSILFYTAGLNYSPDSVQYILAAANLRYAGGFALPPEWPPFFSILIALATFLTPYPAQAAALIVAVSTVAVPALFVLILRRYSRSTSLNILAVAILLSLESFSIGRHAWSEMLFVALILSSLFFAARAQNPNNYRDLFLSFTFAGLAALTRYIGLVLPIALTAALVFNSTTRHTRNRLVLLNGVALAPLTAYLLRNQLLFGSLTGARALGSTSLSQNLEIIRSVLQQNFVAPLLLLIGLAVLFLIFNWHKAHSTIAPITYFILFYFTFLLISSSRVQFDRIDTRLLFPTFPLLLLLLFTAMPVALRWASAHKNEYARFFIPLFAMASLLLTLSLHPRHIREYYADRAAKTNSPAYFHEFGFRLSSTSDAFAQAMLAAAASNTQISIYMLTSSPELDPILSFQPDLFKALPPHHINYAFAQNVYQATLTYASGSSLNLTFHPSSTIPDLSPASGSVLMLISNVGAEPSISTPLPEGVVSTGYIVSPYTLLSFSR